MNKTIVLNGNFTSPVNVNSSLNVDGNVNVNGELIINEKTFSEILDENNEQLDSRITVIEDKHLSSEYTAFEVFPTYTTIPAGETDEVTGLEYFNGVNPWNLFGLELKTRHLQKDSNIIIDWGDGKITDVKNTISEASSPTSTIDRNSMYYPSEYEDEKYEIEIEFTHKYETQGRYIVKIYGNTYWGVRAKYDKGFTNIISRVLEKDLPIASCVCNISSLCYKSERLTRVHIANGTMFPNVKNVTQLFRACWNLKIVSGFSNGYNVFSDTMYASHSLFMGCYSLEKCDYILPSLPTDKGPAVHNAYNECKKLSVDILTLLPKNGFWNRTMSMDKLFFKCNSITCSDYEALGNLLWNDTSKNWTNTASCFKYCTSLDLSQIPKTWGGNKA
jgi:hypothetical protein